MPKHTLGRVAITAAAIIGAVSLSAPLAFAGNESGYKSCSTNYYVASKVKGRGYVEAQVGSYVKYATYGSVGTLTNNTQTSLRTNVYWWTYADYDYSSSYSGSYCEHV